MPRMGDVEMEPNIEAKPIRRLKEARKSRDEAEPPIVKLR